LKKTFNFFQKYLVNGMRILLTPKGPLSLRGTNEISGRYLQVEFLSLFFETFFGDRKTHKLRGNIIFFQSVPGNKSSAQISSKQGRGGSIKHFQKFELKKIKNSYRVYFCLSGKLWFIPFGFVMRFTYEKVMDNLIFQALRTSLWKK